MYTVSSAPCVRLQWRHAYPELPAHLFNNVTICFYRIRNVANIPTSDISSNTHSRLTCSGNCQTRSGDHQSPNASIHLREHRARTRPRQPRLRQSRGPSALTATATPFYILRRQIQDAEHDRTKPSDEDRPVKRTTITTTTLIRQDEPTPGDAHPHHRLIAVSPRSEMPDVSVDAQLAMAPSRQTKTAAITHRHTRHDIPQTAPLRDVRATEREMERCTPKDTRRASTASSTIRPTHIPIGP